VVCRWGGAGALAACRALNIPYESLTDTPRTAPSPRALSQRGAWQPRHRGQGRQAGSKKARIESPH
jgi:hypothetical protein